MPFTNKTIYPLVEIDKKIKVLSERIEMYYSDLFHIYPEGSESGLSEKMKMITLTTKARGHLAKAHMSLSRCYLKTFNKDLSILTRKDRTRPRSRNKEELVDNLNLHTQEYGRIIQEIETIHLEMSEEGCNFWSFIALERAVMEVQFAQYVLLKEKDNVFEQEGKYYVQSNDKRPIDSKRVPS